MKPFNLEAAKAGAKVQTRDGRAVRILATDKASGQPIVALVSDGDGGENCELFHPDGMWARCESDDDLFMAPAEHTGHVNVYSGDSQYAGALSHAYKTEEDAKSKAVEDARAVAVPFTWTE